MSDDDSPTDSPTPRESDNTPSQIPLLSDIVAEGKPVRRRRRKPKENLSLDLDPDPPVIRDLFDDSELAATPLETPTAGSGADTAATPQPDDDEPRGHIAGTTEPDVLDDAAPAGRAHTSSTDGSKRLAEPPSSGTDGAREGALRARADEVVDRLVHEYAREMVARLRSELTSLLDELDSPDPVSNTADSPTTEHDALPVTIAEAPVPPPVDQWEPWLPVEIWQRFTGIPLSWAVVGGWALDLFHGRQTRAHSDIEIEIPRREWPLALSALGDCRVFSAHDGVLTELTSPLDVPPEVRQLWIADSGLSAWHMDVMLAAGDASEWVFKRDETIRAPRSSVTRHHNQIPYLAPEVVLLFKAKAVRDKDQQDFETCLPRLQTHQRDWLSRMIEHLHPGHAWLARLRV